MKKLIILALGASLSACAMSDHDAYYSPNAIKARAALAQLRAHQAKTGQYDLGYYEALELERKRQAEQAQIAAYQAWYAQQAQTQQNSYSPMPTPTIQPMQTPQAGPYGQPRSTVICRKIGSYTSVCN